MVGYLIRVSDLAKSIERLVIEKREGSGVLPVVAAARLRDLRRAADAVIGFLSAPLPLRYCHGWPIRAGEAPCPECERLARGNR